MSLTDRLMSALVDARDAYISRLVSEYNLDRSALVSLWENSQDSTMTKKSSTIPVKPAEQSQGDQTILAQMSKAELVELCKAKQLKTTGTKAVLVSRLSGEEPVVAPKTVSESKKTSTSKVPVIKKLMSKIETVPIMRNQFGNFMHPESKLVFSKAGENVIGKQNDDGSIDDLTPEDINICNKYKFAFTMPENLDKKIGLVDVSVEELEGASDEDIELEVEDDIPEEEELAEDEEEFEEEFEEEYEEFYEDE